MRNRSEAGRFLLVLLVLTAVAGAGGGDDDGVEDNEQVGLNGDVQNSYFDQGSHDEVKQRRGSKKVDIRAEEVRQRGAPQKGPPNPGGSSGEGYLHPTDPQEEEEEEESSTRAPTKKAPKKATPKSKKSSPTTGGRTKKRRYTAPATPPTQGEEGYDFASEASLRVQPIDTALTMLHCGGIYPFELIPEGFPSKEHLANALVEISMNYGTVILDHLPRSERPNVTQVKAFLMPDIEEDPLKVRMLRPFDSVQRIPFEELVMVGETQTQLFDPRQQTLSRVVRIALHDCNMLPWETVAKIERPFPIRLKFQLFFRDQRTEEQGAPPRPPGTPEGAIPMRALHTVGLEGLLLHSLWLSQSDEVDLERSSAFHQYVNSGPSSSFTTTGQLHDSGLPPQLVQSSGNRMKHRLAAHLGNRVRAAVGPFILYVENYGTEIEMPRIPAKRTAAEVVRLTSRLCNRPLPVQPGPERSTVLDMIEREVMHIQSDEHNRAYASVHFTDHMLAELYQDFCVQGVRDKIGTWSPNWYLTTLDQKVMKRSRFLFTNIRVRCDPTQEWCPREDYDDVVASGGGGAAFRSSHDSVNMKKKWDSPVIFAGHPVIMEVTVVELGPLYHSEAAQLTVNLTSQLTGRQLPMAQTTTRLSFGPHPSIPGGWESRYQMVATMAIGSENRQQDENDDGEGEEKEEGAMSGGATLVQDKDVYVAHFSLKLTTQGYRPHLNQPLLYIDNEGDNEHLRHNMLRTELREMVVAGGGEVSGGSRGQYFPTGFITVRAPPRAPPSPLVFNMKRKCKDEAGQCPSVWIPRPEQPPALNDMNHQQQQQQQQQRGAAPLAPAGDAGSNAMRDPVTGLWMDRAPRLYTGLDHHFEVNVTEFFADLPRAPTDSFPLEVELPPRFNFTITQRKRQFVGYRSLRTTFLVSVLAPEMVDDNGFITSNFLSLKGATRTQTFTHKERGVLQPPQKKSKKLSLRFPFALQNAPLTVLAWVVDGILCVEVKVDPMLDKESRSITRRSVDYHNWRAKRLPVDVMVKDVGMWLKMTAKRPAGGSPLVGGTAANRVTLKPTLIANSHGCRKLCAFKAERCSKRVDVGCEGLTIHTPIRLHYAITHPRLKKTLKNSGGGGAKLPFSAFKEGDSSEVPPMKGNLTQANGLSDFRLEFGIQGRNTKIIVSTIEDMRLNWHGGGLDDDAAGEMAVHSSQSFSNPNNNFRNQHLQYDQQQNGGGTGHEAGTTGSSNDGGGGGGVKNWIRSNTDKEMVTYLLPTNTTGARGFFEERLFYFRGVDWHNMGNSFGDASPTVSSSDAVTHGGLPLVTHGGFFFTTDVITAALLPALLLIIVVAGLHARWCTPALLLTRTGSGEDWFLQPLQERRTFVSYFWSQHLWLGVFHPCRPQCREHHAYVLVFILSYHGLLAASTNPEEIFAGVITSLVTTLLCRLAVEHYLLGGEAIPLPSTSAARVYFQKMASKSVILAASAAAGILPPMPRFMLSPNLFLIIIPVCLLNGLTKLILDMALISSASSPMSQHHISGAQNTMTVGDDGAVPIVVLSPIDAEKLSIETSLLMSGWWHQFLLTVVLDAFIVQSVVAACVVFLQSIPLTGYPHFTVPLTSSSKSTAGKTQQLPPPPATIRTPEGGVVSPYQSAQAFLNMQVAHPLVLREEPPAAPPLLEATAGVAGGSSIAYLSVLFGVGTLRWSTLGGSGSGGGNRLRGYGSPAPATVSPQPENSPGTGKKRR